MSSDVTGGFDSAELERLRQIHKLESELRAPGRGFLSGKLRNRRVSALEELLGGGVRGTIVCTHRAPRRNEPCPCGSGRKWKRCCGHGLARPAPSTPNVGADAQPPQETLP